MKFQECEFGSKNKFVTFKNFRDVFRIVVVFGIFRWMMHSPFGDYYSESFYTNVLNFQLSELLQVDESHEGGDI